MLTFFRNKVISSVRTFSFISPSSRMQKNVLSICEQHKAIQSSSISSILQEIENQVKSIDKPIENIYIRNTHHFEKIINTAQLFTQDYWVELYQHTEHYLMVINDPMIDNPSRESRAHWREDLKNTRKISIVSQSPGNHLMRSEFVWWTKGNVSSTTCHAINENNADMTR